MYRQCKLKLQALKQSKEKRQMQKLEIFLETDEVSPFTSIKFRQRGGRKVITPADEPAIEKHAQAPVTNVPLVNAIARAFYWAKLIDLGIVASGSAIASREGLEPSTVNERLRLSLLSPIIIESILSGTQSETLNMQWLTRNSFPADWNKQEKLFQCIQTALTLS